MVSPGQGFLSGTRGRTAAQGTPPSSACPPEGGPPPPPPPEEAARGRVPYVAIGPAVTGQCPSALRRRGTQVRGPEYSRVERYGPRSSRPRAAPVAPPGLVPSPRRGRGAVRLRSPPAGIGLLGRARWMTGPRNHGRGAGAGYLCEELESLEALEGGSSLRTWVSIAAGAPEALAGWPTIAPRYPWARSRIRPASTRAATGSSRRVAGGGDARCSRHSSRWCNASSARWGALVDLRVSPSATCRGSARRWPARCSG